MTLWLSGKPRCCAEDSGLLQIYGSVPAIPNIILSSDPWDIGKLGGDGQGPTSFSPPYFSQISSQYHIFCVEKSAFFVSSGSHIWFNIKCAKIFFWIVTPIVTRCPWLCGADFLHFIAALPDDKLPDDELPNSFVINNATPFQPPSAHPQKPWSARIFCQVNIFEAEERLREREREPFSLHLPKSADKSWQPW